jgi:hypothetical protein
MVVQFTCARRGRTLAMTDLSLGVEANELPRSLRPLLSMTENDDADLVAVGMAMVDGFTGLVPLTRDLIDGLSEAYLLDPPVEEMGYQSIETTLLRHLDVIEMIAAAKPGTLRAVAEGAATSALVSVGLDNDPHAISVTWALATRFQPNSVAKRWRCASEALRAAVPSGHGEWRARKWLRPGYGYGRSTPSSTQPTLNGAGGPWSSSCS